MLLHKKTEGSEELNSTNKHWDALLIDIRDYISPLLHVSFSFWLIMHNCGYLTIPKLLSVYNG